jgi:ribosomal protein S18 acetylase RimI-like enzyme
MALEWIREKPARWDANKQRIVGDAPAGIFDRRYSALEDQQLVPGEWWRVEDNGAVVGYGWLDVVWGDAEILLATDPTAHNRGVGSFTLDKLEAEARARGLNYLYNVVRPNHPDAKKLSGWLEKRGFKASEDGSLLRALVPRSAD